MVRRLAILAAAAALAASAAPALAGTLNTEFNAGASSVSAPLGPRFQMDVPHDPSHVANHTGGTVSIWNNGDGNDLTTLGAGKDRGWAHSQPFDDGAGPPAAVDRPPVGFIFDLSLVR